jgi:hypothetical protein
MKENGEIKQIPVCPRCGSDNVSADAAARWTPEKQEWEVSAIFDKGHSCDDCGAGEVEFDWVEAKNTNEERGHQSVCSLLVASTAHVTATEAQSLTDLGLARGEFGFFLHVAGDPNALRTELGALSEGLQGIIDEARNRDCPYLLLDRDGPSIDGLPTYDW